MKNFAKVQLYGTEISENSNQILSVFAEIFSVPAGFEGIRPGF